MLASCRNRDQMKKILRLPTYVPLEYKVHRDSLTDGSSFRNTSVWRPSHAPRGASWNGPEGSAEGTTASQKPYHSSHRSHTAQPPGGVVGDGTSWGGAPNSRPRQHQSSWKSSLSADTGHSGDGNAVPSPIVTSLGDAVVGERRGWARDATLPSGSSSWGRPSPATTPVGGGFQHKGPDDERGGNYGEFMEGRSQKPSRFQGSGIVGVEVAGFQPRRRFENAPAAPPADDTRKKPATASNSADQVRVWGRAQTIVADAPVAPS